VAVLGDRLPDHVDCPIVELCSARSSTRVFCLICKPTKIKDTITPIEATLQPALLQIAERFGEDAFLDETQFALDDNDLDVDVVATPAAGDLMIGGWPTLLVQCATGPVQQLHNKILEVSNTFCSVWSRGFKRKATLKGGATPDELLQLEPVFWGRLHEAGFVLHRMRLVNLAFRRFPRHSCLRARRLPARVREQEEPLKAEMGEFDWRNG